MVKVSEDLPPLKVSVARMMKHWRSFLDNAVYSKA
jgi:hypothetical protein